MNTRRFRALFERGASHAEIAAACGVDWRIAKKYLQQPAGAPPAATSREGTQPRVIDPFTAVVDAMLRRDIRIPAAVADAGPCAGKPPPTPSTSASTVASPPAG